MNINKSFLVLLVALLFLSVKVKATHLRGGEITVTRPDCGSLTHNIVITVYLDSESTVPFGGGILDFGDGSEPMTIPDQTSDPNPDLANDVATATFSITHTYASAGTYLITYTEPNRNADILNIPNSVNTRFHIETQVVIDPSVGCNSSPVLLIPPIDRACGGVTFYHNPGAYDPDGDSLSYEIMVPKRGAGEIIDGYRFPADPGLYRDYNTANEERDGPPFFNINPVTGLLTWNAPPIPEVVKPEGEGDEYSVAFIVREWRKIYGRWVPLGYVRRDMQIIVETCENEKPELILPDDICVEAGTTINEEILGIDPDNDSVRIEVFSQVMMFEGSPATYEPADNPFQLISSEVQGRVQFQWETSCDHVRDQSYQVVFKITDKPDMGPRLVNFSTWNITVIGPSPEITSVQNEGRSLRVEWEPYMCENADYMQVWRKVDSNPYEPDSCETGMREGAGYKQIGMLSIGTTSFVDNDLAMGAKYCYRLVAEFTDNITAESMVSDEVCYEFVPADAPVITHVSVERTAPEDGAVRVSWKEPFDLDPSFTGDYHYDIYRARGATGNNNITLVETVINDTTFLDQGLNTEDLLYNYRIVLRVPDGPVGNEPVDTSAVASTVRLEPTPEFEKIELTWNAQVPWSNVIATGEGAYHYIYRGADGSQTLNELTLIDSIRVVDAGFNYIDSGQYNNEELKNDQFYCYAVLTRGTYGNPQIESPLDNLSQISCVQPIDTIPPCAPIIALEGVNCENYAEEFGCNFNDFSNELSWSPDPTFTCESDIKHYEIFYAQTTADEFEKLAETRDTVYIDTPEKNDLMRSFKGCYKIRAVDRSGNISDFSNTFCFDNCPNYELPNVITPNGDGCNEVFSAFSDRRRFNESGNINECGELDISRCARFVRSVSFTVFSRWGKEVYNYTSGGENTIFIDWDGRDDNGKPLPPGVYYYVARVEFDVVNPDNAFQDIKGWVHIFR